MDKAKKDQDKGIVLGALHRLHYRRYWHDPNPLAFIMSYTRDDIRCFAAINLHYLLTNHSLLIIKAIKKANQFAIKNGRPLKIEYKLFTTLNLPLISYRLYKYDKVRPIEYIPIDDWEDVIKKERSPWQGKFYGKSQEEIDKLAGRKRKEKNRRAKKRRKARSKRR